MAYCTASTLSVPLQILSLIFSSLQVGINLIFGLQNLLTLDAPQLDVAKAWEFDGFYLILQLTTISKVSSNHKYIVWWIRNLHKRKSWNYKQKQWQNNTGNYFRTSEAKWYGRHKIEKKCNFHWKDTVSSVVLKTFKK